MRPTRVPFKKSHSFFPRVTSKYRTRVRLMIFLLARTSSRVLEIAIPEARSASCGLGVITVAGWWAARFRSLGSMHTIFPQLSPRVDLPEESPGEKSFG